MRCGYLPLIVAGEVDGEQFGAAAGALGLAEKHQNPAVWRPGGPLIMVTAGQNALA